MMLRTQDEKEIKIELMICLFLETLEDKINTTNLQGQKSIEKLSNLLMDLCFKKILSVS